MSTAATHLWHKDAGASGVWSKRFVVISDSIISIYASRDDYESQKQHIHQIYLSSDTELLHKSDTIVIQGFLIKKGKLKWNEKWCVLVNYGYLKYVNEKHGIRSIDVSKANFQLQAHGNLIYWVCGGDRVYFRCDSPSIQKTWYKKMKMIQTNCLQIRYRFEKKKLVHKEPTLFAFTVDHTDGTDYFCAPNFFVLHLWNKCIMEQISRSDHHQVHQVHTAPNIKIVTSAENEVTYINNADAAAPAPAASDDGIYALSQELLNRILLNITCKYEYEYGDYGIFIDNECDGREIETCHSLKRIMAILKVYKQHIKSNKNNIVLSKYLNKIKSDLLNDYHHVLDAHLNQDHIVPTVCNATFEWIYNQILRPENELSCDINNCAIHKRHQLQRDTAKIVSYGADEYLSIYLDLLDSIHCYFLHEIKVSNKFIIPDVQNEQQHKFGYHFPHYWDKWEKPKYCTFKMELINNNLYSIDLNTFNEIYKKANYLLNNSAVIKRIKSSKQSKYAIDDGLALNISNILSVSLYTDYEILSYHFAKTFYCDKRQESNDEYFHWSKLLSETVNSFGIRMKDSKVTTLFTYCALMHWTQFVVSFNAPTSTTTALNMQKDAAADGMILALELRIARKSSNYLRYFNCSFCSRFTNENERLFINPPSMHNNHLLELVSIYQCNENYKPFIYAWSTFNKLIEKQHVPNISSQSVLIINKLINIMHSTQLRYPKPKYIYDSFQKWTDTKTQMVINLKIIKQFGINSLFYVHKNKLVLNLHCINIVFTNMKWIICERVGEINEEFLMQLLHQINKINNLPNSQLNKIYLYDIPNIYEFSQTKIFTKYQSLCSDKKWIIQIKNGYCSDYLVVSSCR